MSDSIKESKHERRVRFHGEAPFAKHDYRYRSRDVLRLAGQIWAESGAERQQRLKRERSFSKMKNTPVGLGFANRDNYGPDDTYRSVSTLSSTPDPIDYIDQ